MTPEIGNIRPDQILEAKHLIYQVAFPLFHADLPENEMLVYYEKNWPLLDLDNFEEEYLHKGGAFLVMMDGDRMIGTGAFKRMEESVCEIKRVWLLPKYQGQKLGYQMMTTIFYLAKEKGYLKTRLATSPAYQARAYAFYRQLGFYEIPRFNNDPNDIGMEMVL